MASVIVNAASGFTFAQMKLVDTGLNLPIALQNLNFIEI
jgi:hypothetical protein